MGQPRALPWRSNARSFPTPWPCRACADAARPRGTGARRDGAVGPGRRRPGRRDRRRLRARAEVPGRLHDAAGPERSGSAGLAPGRATGSGTETSPPPAPSSCWWTRTRERRRPRSTTRGSRRTLSVSAGGRYDAAHLPFTSFTYSADGRSISFAVEGRPFTCDVGGGSCTSTKAPDARRVASRIGVARRQAGGVHPQRQPVGPRRRDRRRDAADDRRREGLRLRDRQRGLDARATGRSSCGRPTRRRSRRSSRTSAASARCTSSRRRSAIRRCRRGSTRCPATRSSRRSSAW